MSKVNSFICCFMVLLAVSCSSAQAKKAEDDHTVSGIYLDVLRIDACARGKGCVAASGPMQLNLLDLADGKVDFASKVLLPARTKELRLVLGDNNTITVDDESFPLDVPSGKSSGLKLKGQRVFGKEGGFLAGLTLSLDLKKQLVLHAKKVKAKGHGKGKKNSVEEVLYSFKLKPVVAVKTAEVEPLPENMAAVVAMPDEDVKFILDDDSFILIPAGAVDNPTVITSVPRNFVIELTDPTTGGISDIPPLSPIYDLSPSGFTFDKPIDVQLHYNEAAVSKRVTEDDLVIYHDGDPIIASAVNRDKDNVTAQISHFSTLSIDVYLEKECVKQGAIVDSDGKAIAGLTHLWCPDWEVYDPDDGNDLGDDNLPNFHLVEGDRKGLAEKYRMDVISIDAATGGQENHTVNELATMNNAVVAVNGNHFGCLTPSDQDKRCYDGGTGRAERIHIEDGEVKGRDASKENVVFAFGGSSNSLIPIERLKTSGAPGENGNSDRIFEDVFSQQFNKTWGSGSIGSKIQVKDGVLNSAIGERTTLLYTLNSETICKPAPNGEDIPIVNGGEDPYPAFGYGKSKILFLASDENRIVSDWDHYYQLCLVLRKKHAENAMLLDGGGSTQMAVRRPAGTGTEVITANNDDDNEDLRHVVNAIALVPKDQEDPEPPTSCPNGNGLYCGESSLSQNTNYLYYCQDGNYQEQQQCANGCEKIYASDDQCKDEPTSCPYGTGLYCGKSSLNQNTDYLYYCQDGNYEEREQCSNGCEVMDPYVDDQCKEAPASCPYGNGLYCGKSSLGQNTNYLYYCQDGSYREQEQCSNGCEVMDPYVDDKCKDSDDGQDTIDAPGDSTADITGSDGSVITTCTFQDVDQTAFYADKVNDFCSAGILIGYSIDGERLFKPLQGANLAETLKVLLYAHDYAATDNRPKDLEPWYSYYITEAQKYGIAATESMAGNPVLRREAMDYIVKIFYGQTVADPVQFLVDKGITTGSDPDMQINRSELVVLAYRAAADTGTINDIKFGRVDEPPAPLPVTSTFGDAVVDRAIPEINHKVSVLENGKYVWADSTHTYCARFVRVMFGKPAKFGSAKEMCNSYQAKGYLQTTGTPEPGDVICYTANSSNGYYGHVAVTSENGKEIGATTLSTGVTERTIRTAGYQGFISAEDFNAYY